MDRISRSLLARAGEQKILSQKAIETALELSGLNPSRTEWRQFAILAMRFAAVLSLASGIIFLVAYNWQNLGLYVRFAMVEAPLLAALTFAWIKGTEQISGKLSLLLAVLLTGALLALFGQTYQTGGNLYEFFAAWAALALPWVIACRYAACWAWWLLLINAAGALRAQRVGSALFLHLFFDRWRLTPWSLPFLFDVLAWMAIVALSCRRDLGLGERWLQRSVMAAALAFGTSAMIYRITGETNNPADTWAMPLEVIAYLAASIGFSVYTYARKGDLFNFAALALSWIVVTAALLIRAMLDSFGIATAFFTAIYVIGASTLAFKRIADIGRTWKSEEAAS